jgi:hypothetical protein
MRMRVILWRRACILGGADGYFSALLWELRERRRSCSCRISAALSQELRCSKLGIKPDDMSCFDYSGRLAHNQQLPN